jgi:Caspase domain
MAASDHALLVGINKYSKLRQLGGAENDAVAMEAWLKDRNGGNVPDENVTTILSSNYPPPSHPTRAKPMTDDIRAELERLIDDSQQWLPKRWRRLYLYLAGHGFSPAIDETALLMANASQQTLHSVPGVRYANYFRETTVFSEIVLIMDCCRDHYPRPPLVDLGLPPMPARSTEAPYLFAFATKWSLKTREGIDSSGQVRGHFTRAFIEALDEPGASSQSVREYIVGRLPELAQRRGYYPPEFRYSKSISFGKRSRRGTEEPMCVVNVFFSKAAPAVMRIINNEEEIVAEATMEDSPWSVPLPRGLYEFLRSDQATRRIAFAVPAGGTRSIDVQA